MSLEQLAAAVQDLHDAYLSAAGLPPQAAADRVRRLNEAAPGLVDLLRAQTDLELDAVERELAGAGGTTGEAWRPRARLVGTLSRGSDALERVLREVASA